jgi:hypothetical protein
MLVPLVMWKNQVTTEEDSDVFLTYILRPGRIMVLTLTLVALMELDLLMTALKTAALCCLSFGLFSGFGDGWMGGILHSVSCLTNFFPGSQYQGGGSEKVV